MEHDPRYGSLRDHQAALRDRARALIAGNTDRFTHAFVTPGGGKTFGAAIFAHELLMAGAVERVLWVVPRDNLRIQVVRDFHSPARGLNYRVQVAKGDKWPRAKQLSLGEDVPVGVVTTYHTIGAAPERAARWVRALPTLVIFDEGHHLPADGIADVESEEKAWTPAARIVANAAAHVLDMSGTPVRHNGRPIEFVPYEGDPPEPQFHVRYTRRSALEERAVLPIEFKRLDGSAVFQHLGREHDVKVSEATKKQAPKALQTLFAEGAVFRDEALEKGVSEWRAFRENVYKSRLIIVADLQRSAKHYAAVIRRMGFDVALAISDEADSSTRIRRFRERPEEAHVLVTVGMAHEGLDVPDCTHMICLTRNRSQPWLEQAFARVTRFDPRCGLSWEDQTAHIYVPDDPAMRRVIADLNAEQIEIEEERQTIRKASPRGPSTFVPVAANHTTTRISDDDRHLADEESALVARLEKEIPELSGAPTRRKLDLARRLLPPIPASAAE